MVVGQNRMEGCFGGESLPATKANTWICPYILYYYQRWLSAGRVFVEYSLALNIPHGHGACLISQGSGGLCTPCRGPPGPNPFLSGPAHFYDSAGEAPASSFRGEGAPTISNSWVRKPALGMKLMQAPQRAAATKSRSYSLQSQFFPVHLFLRTSHSPIARPSRSDLRRVSTASWGEQTMGSPWRLNDVLRTAPTPVSASKAFRTL